MAADRVSTGVGDLDRLLGGLVPGDNFVIFDHAGALAGVFCQNFWLASQQGGHPLTYVTFDRSPKNLLERLGALADDPRLTILDCFTHGKGVGADVFLRFYQEVNRPACRIELVASPRDPDQVTARVKELAHGEGPRGHFVFDSLTGMQEVWGGEEAVINFFNHQAPRLHELLTAAYWVVEKRAHSPRLRAALTQTAQVAVELNLKRGTNSLTVLKAEGRACEMLSKPTPYWTEGLSVSLVRERRGSGPLALGARLKEVRTKKGLSQSELARMVGVTASNISQVESNLIYPSLPALVKIAEVLGVEVAYFFQTAASEARKAIFHLADAVEVGLAELTPFARGRALLPLDATAKAEPYLVEILPRASLPRHFFAHKGEELGHLLEGELEFSLGEQLNRLLPGDTVHLTSQSPLSWRNPLDRPAKLFWCKLR